MGWLAVREEVGGLKVLGVILGRQNNAALVGCFFFLSELILRHREVFPPFFSSFFHSFIHLFSIFLVPGVTTSTPTLGGGERKKKERKRKRFF